MSISTVEKGRLFEQEVAIWLKTQGFRVVERNQRVKVSSGLDPYECDIHAHNYSHFWDGLRSVGLFCCVVSCLAGIFNNREIDLFAQSVISSFVPELAPYGLMIVAIGGIFAARIGRNRTGCHVWVECKDQQAKASRDQMEKLIDSVESLRSYKNAPWKPSHGIFVSRSGFTKDALKLADRHRIECYIKTDQDFMRVD